MKTSTAIGPDLQTPHIAAAGARRPPRGGTRRIGRALALTLVIPFVALGVLAESAGAAADATAVPIGGNPLSVYIGPRGQCQSSYTVKGSVQGNFFPGGEPYAFSPVGDCGFFLAFPTAGTGQPTALKDKTFGFQPNAPAPAFSLYEPVSQSGVGGDGSATVPFTQTTTFEVVDSSKAKDALVTETTTYVNGAPQFASTYNVKNLTMGKLYFRAIYAGDLFVNGNDHGTGVFLGGPPRFVGGQNTASGVFGGLQESAAPALPWSSFQELGYPDVWSTIAESAEEAKAFDETLDASEVDNAIGVEWDQFRATGLAAGAEQAFSVINRTQIPSALNVQPVTQTHTVGQTGTVTVTATDNAGTPYANRPVVYTIGGANLKLGSVTTNASGVATISYVGTAAGIDTMQMYPRSPWLWLTDTAGPGLGRSAHVDAAVADARIAATRSSASTPNRTAP